VGHSLDSDLKALRLVHHKVLDTTALYPNIRGLPFKSSLKSLVAQILNVSIQDSNGDEEEKGEGEVSTGHDSIQDASFALELTLLYLKNQFNPSSNTNNATTSVEKSKVLKPTTYISPTQIPWISNDKFLSPKSFFLDNKLLKNQNDSNLTVNIFSNLPFSERSSSEQFLFGYHLESKVADLINNYSQQEKLFSPKVINKLLNQIKF
jgi:hypothetical protein